MILSTSSSCALQTKLSLRAVAICPLDILNTTVNNRRNELLKDAWAVYKVAGHLVGTV
jgi:hypothetical protein